MRPFIYALALLALLQTDLAAQGKLTPGQFGKLLDESGISMTTDGIYLRVNDNTLKGLESLRRHEVPVPAVEMYAEDVKLCIEALDRVAKLNALKRLSVLLDVKQSLSDDELKSIVNARGLHSLTLRCLSFSETQIKMVAEAKNLDNVSLMARDLPAKVDVTLSTALPKADVYVGRLPALIFSPLLQSGADDSAMTKLQKAKFNAALQGIKSVYAEIVRGKRTPSDVALIEMMRTMKDAMLELNDAALTKRVTLDYVQLAEISFRESELRFHSGAMNPDDYYRMQCHYLDAQIFQLKVNGEKKGR